MRKDLGFVFDFDGTVAETLGMICKCLREAHQNLGLESPTDAEFMAKFGAHEYGIVKMMNPEHADELYSEYLRLHVKYTSSEVPAPYEGIPQILAALKNENIPLAMVTGRSYASTYYGLAKYRLDGYFDIVGCGGETSSVKTARLNNISKRWGISPKNLYYIGDSPSDVSDAREAGYNTLSAAWAKVLNLPAIESKNPDKIFHSIGDFAAWLKSDFAIKL